ncbi:hypothetical protein [Bradyrhizobium sp. LTSP857]|uniref:hypothetical protein n=1 Tax=Bradyrhizobium sp. LTSP857 TaxID=1619231 RepID=UPI0005D1BFF5|nr:hypothetical protein [Bradyrhizobium sp. LTSP857]KJC34812.1 hypothetical protein UP06_35715 [Bradyrhizobium sp. LTSP857]
MKLTLPKVALIAFVATTAFTATSANAVQLRGYGCDVAFFEGCTGFVDLQPPGGARVVRIDRDTSPIYMKQSDPRYNSAMRDAGGGGGGDGGGGGGGR